MSCVFCEIGSGTSPASIVYRGETALGAHRALLASTLVVEGVNLLLADGEAAGQDVFHAHLHVVPRYSGDSFRIEYDWSTQPPGRDDTAAEEIRSVWV